MLYREVLANPLEELSPIARAKRSVRLPVVLTKDEVKQVIARMEETPQLVAMLLYGSGLRVLECLGLRVKDIDFASHEIVVRGGKGDKDPFDDASGGTGRSVARSSEGGLGAPQDATGAERCAVSVGPVDRMFATPPDSPGQCEPGLSDDRPRDPRLCYCPELSPRATRSSSS